MIIDEENTKVQYESTTESPIVAGDVLPFPYRFTEKEQINAVLLDGTKLTYRQDYTVGETSITLSVDIPIGSTITIYRNTPLDQGSEFPQEAKFNSKKIEDALDKLTMQNQEQQEELNRTLKVPISTGEFNAAVPVPLPNRILRIDENATGFEFVPYDLDERLDTFEQDIVQTQNNFEENIEQTIEQNKQDIIQTQNNFEAETNTKIQEFEEETNTKIQEFEEEVNETIQTVADAADRINTLDEDLAIATNAATEARQAASTATNKANEILSVENQFLNKTQITNCLLEIPQNIKLELNNGMLTLKAGSKVIMPNGVGIFEEYTIPTDRSAICTFSGSYADIVVIYLKDKNQLRFCPIRNVNSGSTDTNAGVINHIWYDTTTGLIKYFNDTTTTPYSTQCSLPVCNASNVGTELISFSKINQIFNGFGYIGSTIWADKGVKVLIPNGKNEDGTLKNIEYMTTNVVTGTMTVGRTNTAFCLHNNGSIALRTNMLYNKEQNFNYVGDILIRGVPFAKGTTDSTGRITEYENITNTFHAVDYKDFKEETTYLEENSLNKQQITNCITEVPQNIKLVLNDGTLTLKAGSKVIVPNGNGVFEELTTSNDLTLGNNSNTKLMVFYDYTANVLRNIPATTVVSGATDAKSMAVYVWYDTTNNIIHFTNDRGVTYSRQYSLPLCIIESNSTQIISINQVFNGMGFVGSTVWVDKGVKGLIPNGRNEDGTLKNIEVTTQKVSTITFGSTVILEGTGRVLINQTGTGLFARVGTYDDVNNYVLGGNGVDKLIGCVVLDNGYVTNGRVDNFNFKLPFHAIDYNDAVLKTGDTMAGNLTIRRSSPHIMLIDNHRDNTIAPTSVDDVYGKIQFRDKNNQWLGGVECKRRTNGNLDLQLFAARGINDTTKSAAAYLSVDSTGKALFTFPRCTTSPTTTSTASNSLVAVVVQNYLNGTSWYRVWSDGWIEQGGQASTVTTVTLLKSFKDTNYTCYATPNTPTHGHYENLCIINKTTTTFTTWLASYGYTCDWYACGY